MLIEQARIHEKQECCGLPFCVSCRVVVLLDNKLDIVKSEQFIEAQKQGTKLYYKAEEV